MRASRANLTVLMIAGLFGACGADPSTHATSPRGAHGDPDGDRIMGPSDECPQAAEDADGFEDQDGCPDDDDDGDGIGDAPDLCPLEAEDVDLFEDQDGCPDPDNDQDRILDGEDACPDEPETYNGTEDLDGCPDEGQVQLITCEGHGILDKIYFQPRSSRVREREVPIVEAIARVFEENPQVGRVAVVGHAARNEPRAEALAEDRARAVADALIARGVDPEQLEVHGAGHRAPIDEGQDRGAHERNRRVEFHVMVQDGREHYLWDEASGMPMDVLHTAP